MNEEELNVMLMWDKYDNKYKEVVDIEVAKGLEADLYEANNRINDLLDIVKQKDKLIDLMAQELIDQQVRTFKDNFDPFKYINKEQVKKYFEERCK